ncbi:uncharacterized protein BYT42DRAFT_572304 [Radiomyces spectabilis]|uniref:uncharacterized protein n=1 Tax=Radiomyces spectabilis TaxID=64574 RepID=UPI002220127E|nr:uncharacterized protein BYT42DRAFT_572304 [Radiomyces spectabilis]KAI8377951.1 hypothetical protein BYT42DRAFT_572304 [Radiomyces spectabilis]
MSRMGTPMSMDDVNISPIENTSSQSTLSHQHRFSAEALQIGTWKRISLQSQDLVCQYDTQQHHMVWCIQDGTQRFKMEFSVERIQRIRLEPLLERLGWARLEIHLDQPQLAFYMEDVSQQCWTQCRDFTQDRQATTTLIHQLDGPALALRAELTRIAQDDAYVQQALAQSDQPSLLSNTPSLLDPTQIPNSNSSMIFPNVHPMSSAPTTMMMAMNHDTHSHPHGFDKKQQDQDEFLLFQTLDPPS